MTTPQTPDVNGGSRLKPAWALALETRVAAIPLGRDALAAIKLFILTPLAWLILRGPGEGNWLLAGLVVFILLGE